MVQGSWCSSAPFRVKRLMFLSLASEAALSGAAALCRTDSGIKQLRGTLARKLRSMMGGRCGCWGDAC
eukprot:8725846-Pyramimonas_sp.AAC.1